MHIHQLNVSHVERQDRLLLRLNTQTAEEFRFWLTRRMTLRLLPALEQSLGRLESTQSQVMAPDPASQQILTELKRDAFVKQADFKTPFVEQASQLPLGDEPMLVTDVQLQMQESLMLLTLQDKGSEPGAGQSCQLKLQTSLVHGLIHLIQQAVARAQWHSGSIASTVSTPETTVPAGSAYRH